MATDRPDHRHIRDWFPLYTSDWMTCIELRVCSIAARGLLIELMAYSWHRGHPGVINEDPEIMARYLGMSTPDYLTYLEELHHRGRIVVEWDDAGTNLSLLGDDRVYGKPVSIVVPKLIEVAEEQSSKINAYSEKQRERVNKRWQKDTTVMPRYTTVIPDDTKGEERREEKKREDKTTTRGRVPISDIEDEWNRLCSTSGLQAIRVWSDSRKRALTARLKDDWFREHWREIFAEAHRNEWCRDNRIGIEHLLYRTKTDNALRYYEAVAARQTQKQKQADSVDCYIILENSNQTIGSYPTAEAMAAEMSRRGLEVVYKQAGKAVYSRPEWLDDGQRLWHDGYKEGRVL